MRDYLIVLTKSITRPVAALFAAAVIARLLYTQEPISAGVLGTAVVFALKLSALFALLYVTGCLCITALGSSPFRGGGLVIAITAGAILLGLTGLLLSLFGFFSLPAVLLTDSLVILAFFGAGRHRRTAESGRQAPAARWEWAIFFLLLLYSPPFENIWGGFDAGLYAQMGANVARTGSIVISDPTLALFANDHLRVASAGKAIRGTKYLGYYRKDMASTRVFPQFFHLHPILLGIAHEILGDDYLWLTPFLAVMSVLAFFYVSREVFPASVALVVSAALAVNLQQVWSGRSSLSEILSQLFVWAFVFAVFSSVKKETDREQEFLLVFAALCLGSLGFTRIDAIFVFLAGSIVPLLLFGRVPRRALLLYGLSFIGSSALSFLYALTIASPYTYDSFVYVTGLPAHAIYGVFLALLSLTTFSVFIPGVPKVLAIGNRIVTEGRWRREVMAASALFVLLVAVYAYFVYPSHSPTYTSLIYLGKPLPTYDEQNLYRLGWYFTPFGLGIVIVGLAFFIARGSTVQHALLGTLALGSSYMLIRLSNNPIHVYAFRRYVPVIIPFLTLSSGFFLCWLKSRGYRLLSICVGTSFVVVVGLVSVNLVGFGDFTGASRKLDELAGQIDKRALVLVDRRDGVAHWFGPPIEYIEGLAVYPVNGGAIDASFLEKARSRYRSIYLLTKMDLPVQNTAEKFADFTIDVPKLEQSYGSFPRGTGRFIRDLALYELHPREKAAQGIHKGDSPVWVLSALSDSMVKTEVGLRDAKEGVIRSTGGKGFLQFGPYRPLHRGVYRIEWIGTVEKATGEDQGFVDVVADRGGVILSKRALKLDRTQSEGVIARMTVRVTQDAEGVECRFYVNDGVVISLRRIVVTKLPEPAPVNEDMARRNGS